MNPLRPCVAQPVNGRNYMETLITLFEVAEKWMDDNLSRNLAGKNWYMPLLLTLILSMDFHIQ